MITREMMTMDGNTAVAHLRYAFSVVAAFYPITPSSTMAEVVDEWAAHGKKNIFGHPVKVVEMQSEAGAAGAVHGSLQAGSLTTTFTASQGLLLMVPNMYKIAGELLPGVFQVSARAIAGHALSIFGDHSDVMATRQTGFALLASGSVQEVIDLASVAHLSSIKASLPFLHFFDGFRTSHEIQKVEIIDYRDYYKLIDMDALKRFKEKALRPENPVARGSAQNPDIFFQMKESSNRFYEELPSIVTHYMDEIGKLTGRKYSLFDYYGDPEAKHVVVAMGSVTEALEETVDYLNAKGEKTGVLKVRLYRPFVTEAFLSAMPASVEKVAVLDRTKEPGSPGEPLFLDVRSAYQDQEKSPLIVGGRYGLGSKDTTPTHLNTVFENLKREEPKNNFTISIIDDVTHLSLPVEEKIMTEDPETVRCKFWGLGSDGTVGANKAAIKIIGDNTDMYAQGYFAYDSKKSGGVTISHLRFGKKPIRSTYLIDEADYIACHNQAYVNQYDLLAGIKQGGTFVLNTTWDEEELNNHLPASLKRDIAKHDVKFYTINATALAEDVGLGGRINNIMQTAFFQLANVLPIEDAVAYLKESIEKDYGRLGENVVLMNYEVVDRAADELKEVKVNPAWAEAVDEEEVQVLEGPDFIQEILVPMTRQEGDALPVSAFAGMEDGTFPSGTSAYEKRGIAVHLPEWQKETCIQCNQCAYVCPHASVRAFLADEEEMKNAPEGFETLKALGRGMDHLQFKIQVSPLDCTGCGNCADVCPAPKGKALVMKPFESQLDQQIPNWDFALTLSEKEHSFALNTVKGSQFNTPLLEFSGACAGCGETPYIKAITQLFGERMVIANATGCTSIWGASAPSIPYTTNTAGRGPAWANSLFEDNAEYGFGMATALKNMRESMKNEILANFDALPEDKKEVFEGWVAHMNNYEAQKPFAVELAEIVEQEPEKEELKSLYKMLRRNKNDLTKKSVWIFGGDGWAYDIGYGGLDHVLASGEDVNVLVVDTEVYSNTGGQASKSTPIAAVAKFAASGKKVNKKDLGMIATTYQSIYVAQVAMGANQAHYLKVLEEAESFPGPSLIIAYAPCISHGIVTGMGTTHRQEKLAVEAGYWHLWRFDPRKIELGENPFTLDSKEPTGSFLDFLKTERRFTILENTFPEEADVLFKQSEAAAKRRLNSYKRMAEADWSY